MAMLWQRMGMPRSMNIICKGLVITIIMTTRVMAHLVKVRR